MQFSSLSHYLQLSTTQLPQDRLLAHTHSHGTAAQPTHHSYTSWDHVCYLDTCSRSDGNYTVYIIHWEPYTAFFASTQLANVKYFHILFTSFLEGTTLRPKFCTLCSHLCPNSPPPNYIHITFYSTHQYHCLTPHYISLPTHLPTHTLPCSLCGSTLLLTPTLMPH